MSVIIENMTVTGAVADVIQERQRQIHQEGYDELHDGNHSRFELAGAPTFADPMQPMAMTRYYTLGNF